MVGHHDAEEAGLVHRDAHAQRVLATEAELLLDVVEGVRVDEATAWDSVDRASEVDRARVAQAHELLHRRHPADHLVDGGADEGRVVAKPLQLIGMRQQRVQAAGDRGRGGVVAGSRDDHVVADGLEDPDRRAVHLGVRDHRGEVVGRVGAAILGQGHEVLEEVLDRRHELFGRRAACHLGVGRAEQLLCQLEQAREVVLGQAEDREDHVERIVHGNVSDEVALTTQIRHVPADLPDDDLEPRTRVVARGVDGLLDVRTQLREVHRLERRFGPEVVGCREVPIGGRH